MASLLHTREYFFGSSAIHTAKREVDPINKCRYKITSDVGREVKISLWTKAAPAFGPVHAATILKRSKFSFFFYKILNTSHPSTLTLNTALPSVNLIGWTVLEICQGHTGNMLYSENNYKVTPTEMERETKTENISENRDKWVDWKHRERESLLVKESRGVTYLLPSPRGPLEISQLGGSWMC